MAHSAPATDGSFGLVSARGPGRRTAGLWLLPLLVRWLPEYSFPHEALIGINLAVLGFSVALAIVSGLCRARPGVPVPIRRWHSSCNPARDGWPEERAESERTIYWWLAKLLSPCYFDLRCCRHQRLCEAGSYRSWLRSTQHNVGWHSGSPEHARQLGEPVHLLRSDPGTRSSDAGSCGGRISSNATPPSNGWDLPFEVFGRPSVQQEHLRANFVSPEYFSVLRIPLLQGRLWEQPEIVRGARLAVINQTLARQRFRLVLRVK